MIHKCTVEVIVSIFTPQIGSQIGLEIFSALVQDGLVQVLKAGCSDRVVPCIPMQSLQMAFHLKDWW